MWEIKEHECWVKFEGIRLEINKFKINVNENKLGNKFKINKNIKTH